MYSSYINDEWTKLLNRNVLVHFGRSVAPIQFGGWGSKDGDADRIHHLQKHQPSPTINPYGWQTWHCFTNIHGFLIHTHPMVIYWRFTRIGWYDTVLQPRNTCEEINPGRGKHYYHEIIWGIFGNSNQNSIGRFLSHVGPPNHPVIINDHETCDLKQWQPQVDLHIPGIPVELGTTHWDIHQIQLSSYEWRS